MHKKKKRATDAEFVHRVLTHPLYDLPGRGRGEVDLAIQLRGERMCEVIYGTQLLDELRDD